MFKKKFGLGDAVFSGSYITYLPKERQGKRIAFRKVEVGEKGDGCRIPVDNRATGVLG